MTTTAEVARQAAAYIREHGLAKEDLLGPNGEACFNGAIMLQFAPPDYRLPLYDTLQLWKLVGGLCGPTIAGSPRWIFFDLDRRAYRILRLRGALRRDNDVIQWNNEEERTAEEVASLLDEIAKELESESTACR